MFAHIIITFVLVATARAGIATSYVLGDSLRLRGLGSMDDRREIWGGLGDLTGLRLGKLRGVEELGRIGIDRLGGLGLGIGKIWDLGDRREIRIGKLDEGELGRLDGIGELREIRIGKLGREDEIEGIDRLGGIGELGGITRLGGMGELRRIDKLESDEELGGIGIGIGRIDGGILLGKRERVVDLWAPPKYEFKYGVEDPKTGDRKEQVETRLGDVVKGEYSLAEPDGTIRVVKYTADDKNGFNAIVSRIGKALHPTVVLTKGSLGLGEIGLEGGI